MSLICGSGPGYLTLRPPQHLASHHRRPDHHGDAAGPGQAVELPGQPGSVCEMSGALWLDLLPVWLARAREGHPAGHPPHDGPGLHQQAGRQVRTDLRLESVSQY